MAKATKKELQRYITAYENARKRKIEAADMEEGHARNVLKDFSKFTTFDRNGLDVELSFTAPGEDTFTPEVEKQIFDIAKTNMQALYDAAPGWSWTDAKKSHEFRDPKARYVLARNRADGALVGFAAFRFLLEDDFDVLYVYELQLTAAAQHKGLGRFLMQLMELVARKNHMQWVLLTVLKNNTAAMDFYTKMKYEIDSSSPSASGEDAGHEILGKMVDKAGVAEIEERLKALQNKILPADAEAMLAGKVLGAVTKAPTAAGAGTT